MTPDQRAEILAAAYAAADEAGPAPQAVVDAVAKAVAAVSLSREAFVPAAEEPATSRAPAPVGP